MMTSQFNIRPVFDVHADVQGRDLTRPRPASTGDRGGPPGSCEGHHEIR